ncbi:MAG: response regulator [Cyanobacteria bacterium J06598_3]
MNDTNDTLVFAERLVHEQTDTYCSELQRQILIAALQGERKTYDQIAEACGYSPKYVKQDVAPKLWKLLTRALNQKISKANVRSILEHTLREQAIASQARYSITSGMMPTGVTLDTQITAATTAAMKVSPPVMKPLTAHNILLVDDQPKNLRVLSDLLEEQGYEVQQAINGTVALQAVALSLPDLILLDIRMPDMDGYTVCQRLKANPQTQDVPVIFVSASDEAWDKVKAFSAGGSDYITKPFKVVEVLARVENQLKVRQLQQALMVQNTQLQQAIQELQRLAALDETTQTASRRRFDAYLLECWQQAVQKGEPIALMLCQVDNFNAYGIGVARCDRNLHQIAAALKQTVQGSEDLVSRYGTLTFAILLPQQKAPQVAKIAASILQSITALKLSPAAEKPTAKTAATDLHQQVLPATSSKMTMSIGISTALPGPNMGLEAFLEACDRNLTQAKLNGGNCIVST